jgi:hypothetical protein
LRSGRSDPASSFALSHFGSSPWRNLGWIVGSLLLIWVAINLAKHWLDRRD